MNIVITGASSGIGRETARILALIPGNRVIVIARNGHKIQALAGECNLQRQETAVLPIIFDLSMGAIDELTARIVKHFREVDILINNAGSMLNKPFGEVTNQELNHVFDVNLRVPYMLSQALLPYYSGKAHILNISSMGGVQGSVKFAGLSAYSASKGALAVLTECMALELASKHIAVNCLAFGAVQTDMLLKAFPGYTAPVTAGEMAAFTADFALNGPKYFNGKILPVSLSTP